MLATLAATSRTATTTTAAAVPKMPTRSLKVGPSATSLAQFDQPIRDIVNYVTDYKVTSDLALSTSRLTAFDAIGCGLYVGCVA